MCPFHILQRASVLELNRSQQRKQRTKARSPFPPFPPVRIFCPEGICPAPLLDWSWVLRLSSAPRICYLEKTMSEVTRIFDRMHAGDATAAEELLPLVYDELRRLAAHKMANEAAGHTLQPTALVHEAWLRLVDAPDQHWNSRNHFFMAAAEAMRRILIERARQKSRLKRGGDQQRVPLDELDLAVHADSGTLLLVEEALERLATREPVKAHLVKLRFFVGLSLSEAAAVLGVSDPTAKRYWAHARAWLFQELERLR